MKIPDYLAEYYRHKGCRSASLEEVALQAISFEYYDQVLRDFYIAAKQRKDLDILRVHFPEVGPPYLTRDMIVTV